LNAYAYKLLETNQLCLLFVNTKRLRLHASPI